MTFPARLAHRGGRWLHCCGFVSRCAAARLYAGFPATAAPAAKPQSAELLGLGKRNVSQWVSLHTAAEGKAVQALLLIMVYILTTVIAQFGGFLISRLVDVQFPAVSVMTFLVLFLVSFGIAWPIAVRVTEWLIVRAGRVVETRDARAV
jgi:hypothetical protein